MPWLFGGVHGITVDVEFVSSLLIYIIPRLSGGVDGMTVDV